ncbi:hypothetical protein ACG0Z6_08900 [Roseateles sp. BYS180W]|uniref:Uncharacterized protein n=1 Tax=Roseateles rivi TaxID=3299028 RepID=A0ABW7FVM4_9BURK
MKLNQAEQVCRWMALHGRRHPVEAATWNGVIMLALLGYAVLPMLVLTQDWLMLPVSLAAVVMPEGYAGARRRLHRRQRLRCDWLGALR